MSSEHSVQGMHAELEALLEHLLRIGVESPELLMFLGALVAPTYADGERYAMLTQMFDEVPGVLQQLRSATSEQLLRVLADPPADAVTLRLFLELRELRESIAVLSSHVLLQLSTIIFDANALHALHALLGGWSSAQLAEVYTTLGRTPLMAERRVLLELMPQTPLNLVHAIIELLKGPREHAERLRHYLASSSAKRINLLAGLLGHEPAVVLHVKQALAPDEISIGPSSVGGGEGVHFASDTNEQLFPVDDDDFTQPPPALPRTSASSASHSSTALPQAAPHSIPPATTNLPPGISQLEIATQPPSETVYNRLLKPYPSVRVTGELAEQNPTKYFVECVCVNATTMTEVPLCLQGINRAKLLPTAYAQFKKLKLAFTTQQQGCQFRLTFKLQRYTSGGYEDIDGAVAHSVPITVYSHTQYLSRNDGQSAVATTVLPVLNELIPSHTVRGSKLCLLGSGFVRGSALRVRVGGIDVQPVFHETGTLVCVVPNLPASQSTAAVAVSNDGGSWSEEMRLTVLS